MEDNAGVLTEPETVSLLDQRFFVQHWRRQPTVVRLLTPIDLPNGPWPDLFYTWCRPPAVARLFVRAERDGPGLANAYITETPGQAGSVFEMYSAMGEPMTLLLNGLEEVAAVVRGLRSSMAVGRGWRYDDIVGTLSTPGSGIGYHAGHEDSIIVQLHGSRLWRVWSSSLLSDQYRFRLLGLTNSSAIDQRPPVSPLFEVILNKGEILYIPPLFGHEGITIEPSVSLSIGWRGLSPYRLIAEIDPDITQAFEGLSEDLHEELFRLIDDPNDQEDLADYLIREMAPVTRLLEGTEMKARLLAGIHLWSERAKYRMKLAN